MKKFVLIGCLLALSGQVMAADWKHLYTAISNDAVFKSWHGDTESRTNDKAWFKLMYFKPIKINGKDTIETRYYILANCSNNQITILSGISYGLLGKEIVSDSFHIRSHELDRAAQYVVPDTAGEAIFKFICHHDPS